MIINIDIIVIIIILLLLLLFLSYYHYHIIFFIIVIIVIIIIIIIITPGTCRIRYNNNSTDIPRVDVVCYSEGSYLKPISGD